MLRPMERSDDTTAPQAAEESAPTEEAVLRAWARKHVEKKRKLLVDIVAYVGINVFLLVTWALTGGGYFWPGWVLSAWGVLLALDVWQLSFHRPITEADIDRELRSRR